MRLSTEIRLLLFFVLLTKIRTQQWEVAGISLGRGYDLILGNPFFLHPGQEKISEALDPGMKKSRVLDENDLKLAEVEEEAAPPSADCSSESKYTLEPREFRKRMVREMFFQNPEWHYKLKDYAISGDGLEWHYKLKDYAISGDGLENGTFPEKALFLDEYRVCSFNNTYESKDIGMKKVSEDFARAICELPDEYDPEKYSKVIHNYGTSVITKVKIGTLAIRRFKKKFTKMRSVREQLFAGEPWIYRKQFGTPSSFYVKLTAGMVSGLNRTELRKEAESVLQWQVGSQDFPSPVRLGLENLDAFLTEDYWQDCGDGCCDRLDTIRRNMVQALTDYPQSLGVTKFHFVRPIYEIKWPQGTYSMFSSGNSCPSGTGFKWLKGTVIHHQGDKTKHVEGSRYAGPHLESRRRERGTIKQEFCTKKQSSEDEQPWPKGSYCIYKHGNCPQGFESGWIYWDDVDGSFYNKHSGTVPDGVYDSNTKIYFCCREDGSQTQEIILPVSEPLTLMRVGKRCQKVKWAKVHESSVLYDGSWVTSWFRDGYFMGGAHPDNEISYSNNRLFYCLYTHVKVMEHLD